MKKKVYSVQAVFTDDEQTSENFAAKLIRALEALGIEASMVEAKPVETKAEFEALVAAMRGAS